MKPKQFNFQQEWNTSIKLIRNRPKVVKAMDRLARSWFESAEFKRDENKDFDAIQADAEFQLDLMTFAVKHWDLHWLCESWEAGSYELAELSLAIAETLFPNTLWELIDEVGCDYLIAADTERKTVLDIVNFRRVPGGASLLLARDKKYLPDDDDLKSVESFLEEKCTLLRSALSIAQSHVTLSRRNTETNIIPLNR